MADTTISSLNTVNALSANNFIPISDGTNTTKLGTDSLFGFRNRLINGDMRIDQRNNGIELTNTSGGFISDRWLLQANANIIFQNVNDAPPGFVRSSKITSTASSTNASFINFIQIIEGNNINDFKWGTAQASPITISFWVKASLVGTYSVSAYNKPGTPTRAYSSFFSIIQSNTWERKTLTIPGDTQGVWENNESVGIVLGFTLFNKSAPINNSWFSYAPGTDGTWKSGNANFKDTVGATFQITGVQLEEGNSATPFERRPFGLELSLCQRYFEKSYNINKTGFSFSINGGESYGMSHPLSLYRGGVKFAVNKRTVPVVSTYDSGGNGGAGANAKHSYYSSTWFNNGTFNVFGPNASETGFYAGHGFTNAIETQYGWTAEAEL